MSAQKKFKLKKGDTVIVTTGQDKGKTGEILSILTSKDKIIIKGVNLKKKHRKPSQSTPGGIVEIEAAIHVSNVSIVDPKTSKASRVGYKIEEGKKTRFSKSSGEMID